MQLTPEMIREQRFRGRLSGFDKEEVTSFLVGIAEDMEELLEENNLLKSELDSMKEKQKDLEDLFLSAKQFSDEKKRLAEQEAQMKIAEAQERAREILSEAQQMKSALEKELTELKAKRTNLFTELRSVLDSYQNWIREMGNVDPSGR